MQKQSGLSRIHQFLKSIGTGGGKITWGEDFIVDLESRVTITERIPTVPGEKGSPFHRTTAFGIVFNHLEGKNVKIKRSHDGFEDLVILEVKLEDDKFWVAGQFFFEDGSRAGTSDWIPEDEVYLNMFW